MMKNASTVQNVNLYLSEARIDKVSINEVGILFQFLQNFPAFSLSVLSSVRIYVAYFGAGTG